VSSGHAQGRPEAWYWTRLACTMIAAMAAAVSPSFPKTLPKLVKRFDKVWLPGFRSTFRQRPAQFPPRLHPQFVDRPHVLDAAAVVDSRLPRGIAHRANAHRCCEIAAARFSAPAGAARSRSRASALPVPRSQSRIFGRERLTQPARERGMKRWSHYG
jgi:hypothetical protein